MQYTRLVSLEDQQKWDARYRAKAARPAGTPSPFLLKMANELPAGGRCLDVAGGGGRNALWLASRGLDVTIADISVEGLRLAEQRAAAAGLQLTTQQIDLEQQPLPAGPWQLIVSVLYLNRTLFPAFADVLAPGGLLLFLQPTTTNLERHRRPPAPFLLRPGELSSLLPPELEIVSLREEWTEDGHHEARLLARKPRA